MWWLWPLWERLPYRKSERNRRRKLKHGQRMIGHHGILVGKTLTKIGLWAMCVMEVGTFRTTHLINPGMRILGRIVGTGIRIRNHFGALRNCLQDLAPRQLWSKLRLVSLLEELFRLCSHHFLQKDLFRQWLHSRPKLKPFAEKLDFTHG